MQYTLYSKIFAKRAVLCFFVVIMLLFTCILRTAVIATGNYKHIQYEQTNYKIEISSLRGTIYDCNMASLTNNVSKNVAIVAPTPKAIMKISQVLSGEELKKTLETLKNNKPAICYVDDLVLSEGIASTTVYSTSETNYLACHLLGYTDSSGHGITGLQLAYDDYLYSDKKITANFVGDGKGNILKGVQPYFENDLSAVYSGIVTTIDYNIQSIVEKAISQLNSGCAIVADVKTSKIRAMASVPTFDIADIAKSLKQSNSPMLNRVLCTYNVGSVFKPCVAVAAIESKKANKYFNCTGSIKIDDRNFKCHNYSGHGNINLCNSLAQSCNCYFYRLAIDIGAQTIYNTASNLNFGTKIKIADNLYASAGNIPNLKNLSSKSTLANLSIGQGSLMVSPVAMLNLYLAIAGDGSYYLPSVIEKTIIGNAQKAYDIGKPTKVMGSETAAVLRNYLKNVITDGTGTDAATSLVTAAGKTGTAQTGRYYDNGVEITNSWFCGFFPAEEPQYVVVVMSDSSSDVSTARIFAQITDKIAKFKGINVENNN